MNNNENEDITLPMGDDDTPISPAKKEAEESPKKQEIDPSLRALLNQQNSGEDSDGNDEIIKKLNKQNTGSKKKAYIWGGTIGAVLIAGAVGSFFIVNNGLDIESKGKETRGITEKVAENEDGSVFWETEEGAKIPVETFTFEADTNNAVVPLNAELATAITQDLGGTDLFSAAQTLPSEFLGFTSNDELAYEANGQPNPYYSYWTQEVFTAEAGRIIQSALNPAFGNWTSLQYPGGVENFNIENLPAFSRVLAPSVASGIADKSPREYLPIFADWDSNNYNESSILDSGPRWYGEVKSATVEFVYDETTSLYTANYVADVVYKAFTKDGATIERKGVMNIEFLPNAEQPGGTKVLMGAASLTMS